MVFASATTRGRVNMSTPRAARTPRPIIAIWSPRWKVPGPSPVLPCRPVAMNANTPKITGAAIQQTIRARWGRAVTVAGTSVTTPSLSQPAGVDVGDQDGPGAEVVELVHDAVHLGAQHHRLDRHPAFAVQR